MNFLEPRPEDALMLLEAVPGKYLILLPDAPHFTIVAATDDYLEATLTQRQAILGKGVFEVFTDNPDNPQADGVRNLRASLMQVLSLKQSHQMAEQRYDVWNETRDAYERKVWLPLNKPVLDASGAIRYICHWVDDVTEHSRLKEAEAFSNKRFQDSLEELEKTTERFHLLNRATQDAVWDRDLLTSRIWWNEGFKTLFGYRDEEIEPGVESWYNRLHPEDRERIISGIHSVIDNGGTNWSLEYRFRKADGSYALVFDRGYALHDRQGKPYRMLGSMIDVTGYKKMMDTVQESEAHLRLAMESARLGTFEIDMTEQSIVYSARTAQIFGFEVHPPCSYEAFRQTIFPDDTDIRAAAHEAALKTGALFYEARIVRADGVLRWIRLNGQITALGGKKSLIGTVLDITEEKKSAEQLELQIEERTRELIQANDQLKQFTYAASHDLQEPLRKISFFVERLVSNMYKASEEENQRLADRILHTVGRMRTLIDDLLNYSNTTQGGVRRQNLALNELVQEVLDDMEATIIEKGAVVEVAELPLIHGDYRQLKQMFQNLISNALKYHKPEDAPRVQIECRIVAPLEHSKRMELTIRDNGIGFSQEDAGRIFGLFQRLHGRSEYEGTGVGLAIVQKVVENHNGFIRAESAPGKGATFRVSFPMEEQE